MNPAAPDLKPRDAANRIVLAEQDRFLAGDIKRLSGTDLSRCYHCRSCGNGCPFIRGMDYPPNGIIRLVQYGLRRQALESHAIWICVGCHTCSVQCPMAIDIAAVMGTLRHLALEEGVVIAESNILDFHREVLHSINQYGRTHKLGIMLRYKVRVRQWFADLDVGLRMLAKRKMDLTASRVKAIDEITRLFIPDWKR
ncbi:MAG: heterodisulfide reductase [Deltaproteobacteria bacterium]|nr:heterodisulfide reductase [Deltaproteobacteria bacterium]